MSAFAGGGHGTYSSTTSTTRKKAIRFKALVERHGKRKIYSLFLNVVREKLLQLSQYKELTVYPYHGNEGNLKVA
jgi:hypothetical protein